MIIYFEGKTMENHFTDSWKGELMIIVYIFYHKGWCSLLSKTSYVLDLNITSASVCGSTIN